MAHRCYSTPHTRYYSTPPHHQQLEALDEEDSVGVLEVEALDEAADPVETQELAHPKMAVSNEYNSTITTTNTAGRGFSMRRRIRSREEFARRKKI